MKILARIDEEGKIVAKIYHTDIEDKEGLIEIDDYKEPKSIEGKYYIEYYRDGNIEVVYKDVPESNIDKVKREFQEQLAIRDMAIFDVVNMMMDVAGGGNNA